MSVFHSALLALSAFGLAAPVVAGDPAVVTTSIRVARPHASSPVAIRHLRTRIADAALEACGGSTYSAAEMKAAVARSRCWQEAYASGVAQIDGGVSRLASAQSPMPDRRP